MGHTCVQPPVQAVVVPWSRSKTYSVRPPGPTRTLPRLVIARLTVGPPAAAGAALPFVVVGFFVVVDDELPHAASVSVAAARTATAASDLRMSVSPIEVTRVYGRRARRDCRCRTEPQRAEQGGSVALSDEEQHRRREAMRSLMVRTPYIGGLGAVVEEWSPDGVRMRLPFADRLTNDGAAYHGGAVASLIDTAGSAAVWAGHDFDRGAHAATLSLTVNYVGAGRDADLVAHAVCVKRGRDVSFSEIEVRDSAGRLVATGSLVYRIVP